MANQYDKIYLNRVLQNIWWAVMRLEQGRGEPEYWYNRIIESLTYRAIDLRSK